MHKRQDSSVKDFNFLSGFRCCKPALVMREFDTFKDTSDVNPAYRDRNMTRHISSCFRSRRTKEMNQQVEQGGNELAMASLSGMQILQSAQYVILPSISQASTTNFQGPQVLEICSAKNNDENM
nr:hypothetical protein Iba_chr09fCG7530 [Ipomoea batatas]